jgi:hypothetical protein
MHSPQPRGALLTVSTALRSLVLARILDSVAVYTRVTWSRKRPSTPTRDPCCTGHDNRRAMLARIFFLQIRMRGRLEAS